MRRLKPETKRKLKWLGRGLVVGVVVTIGFLSFTGMMLVAPKVLWLAYAAFIFGGVIEGEVYIQNIFKGLLRVFTRNYLEQQLIARKLKELADDENNQLQFIKEYRSQLEFLNKLRENHAAEADILAAEKSLFAMQKYVFLMLENAKKAEKAKKGKKTEKLIETEVIPKELVDIMGSKDEVVNFNKKIRRKKWWVRAMIPFYAAAGISCGFASLYSAHTGFYALYAHYTATHAGLITLMTAQHAAHLSMIFFSVFGPLAVIAAVGYILILSHSISSMIQNDKVQSIWKDIISNFTYKGGDKFWHKVWHGVKVFFFGLLSAFFIGLCVFATLATAGTWWFAVQHGAQLLPYIKKAAIWIRNIAVALLILPVLLFDIKLVFLALRKLSEIKLSDIGGKLSGIGEKLDEIWKADGKNLFRFLNPFRLLVNLISGIGNLFILVVHAFAAGIGANKLFKLSPLLVGIGNGINEGWTDVPFAFVDDEKTKKADNHDHGVIIKVAMTIILFIPKVLSALWTFLFTPKISIKEQFKETFAEERDYFGKKEPIESFLEEDDKKTADAGKKWELLMKFEKKAQYYENKEDKTKEYDKAREKKDAFVFLRNEFKKDFSLSGKKNEEKIGDDNFGAWLTRKSKEQKDNFGLIFGEHQKTSKGKAREFVDDLQYNKDKKYEEYRNIKCA